MRRVESGEKYFMLSSSLKSSTFMKRSWVNCAESRPITSAHAL